MAPAPTRGMPCALKPEFSPPARSPAIRHGCCCLPTPPRCFQRRPAVPSPADGRQDGAAAARWLAERLEHSNVLFPGDAASRLHLCASADDPVWPSRASRDPCACAGGLRGLLATRFDERDTARQRRSGVVVDRPARGDGRPTVFRAVSHGAFAAALVLAHCMRRLPIPISSMPRAMPAA